MSATTIVLGASPDPGRYSHTAVERLRRYGHDVIAVGKRSGDIGDVRILQEAPADVDVDTVTLYLSSANQSMWESTIRAWRPRRVIFNPGAENARFAHELREQGVEVVEGCTLVMLSVGTY